MKIKWNSKKIILLLLSFMLIFGTLIGCTNKVDEKPKDSQAVGQMEVVKDVVLAGNGSTKYHIVYDSSLEEGAMKEVNRLVRMLSSKINVEMEAVSDVAAPVGEDYTKEILVGHTNRSVSGEIANNLHVGEYRISYDATRDCVAILGGCADSTKDALQYFIKTYLNLTEDCLVVPSNLAIEELLDKEYQINSLAIQGVDIRNYNIVIPQNCDVYTRYAALNLSDYIKANVGVIIPVIDDSAQEKEYEILVGMTNRTASSVSASLGNKNYFLMQNGNKLVMQGKDLYVGGSVGAFVTEYLSDKETGSDINIQNIPTTVQVKTYAFATEYKNVILMIGDGMGYNHINMALANGMKKFYAQDLPYSGSVITRSQSVIEGKESYTDSAAAGTAMATGYKTYNGSIGLDKNEKIVKNVRELAHEYGAKTAVLTTDSINGATPAAFLCHNNSRADGTGLQSEIDKLISDKKVDYAKGSVGDELFEQTREALVSIADTKAPFFAMVEEGHIDKKSHNKDASGTIQCVERFNECIAYVIEFVLCHPDTALIITADHETGGIQKNADSQYGYQYSTGNHTDQDVPIYTFGAGANKFHNTTVENIEIARFIARAYGAKSFGQ